MIGPAIFSLLSHQHDVFALTNTRITPGLIPQDQPVPCIYYGVDRIKPLPVRNPMGCFSGTLEVGWQVNEDSYDQLEAIEAAVRKVLDNFSGIAEGASLKIQPGITTPDDYDGDMHLLTRALEFEITGQLITVPESL